MSDKNAERKRRRAIQSLLEARAQIDTALRAMGHEPVVVSGSLGEKIAARRSELRLSLQEVADRAAITKSHMWELEQGRSVNPTINTVANLAAALGLKFADLAFEDNQ